MWKRLKDTDYFLMFTRDYGFEIYITDYISIWTTVFSEKAFLAQLKQSNEGLELENDNELIKKGDQLLSNPENLRKITVEKDDNGKSLFVTMSISFGFPFYLECKLSKGSEELFFQHITQPLLKAVSDLRASQCELKNLLIKKDEEIQEYKCEGGEIALRHLKTVAFNVEEHMKRHKVYEETFGTNDVPSHLIDKKFPKPPPVKQETNGTQNPEPSIKMEPKIKVEIKNEPEPNSQPEDPISGVLTSVSSTEQISCKEEAIKSENRPTHRAGIPRKRSKFNF